MGRSPTRHVEGDMVSRGTGGAGVDLARIFRGESAAGLSDRELLAQFAGGGDRAESAFAALVGRHGPMVAAVCRRWLRDPADAADAFQATFLVLVRRAPSIRVEESLGPWLHGVGVRVARRARAAADRRKGRERTNLDAFEPAATATTPDPADALRAVLDEALDRLPSAYRRALVLCYLEGSTHEEAAQALNCPVGTVRSRLARGRDLLRSRLTRRGLAPLSPALLAGL